MCILSILVIGLKVKTSSDKELNIDIYLKNDGIATFYYIQLHICKVLEIFLRI